VTALLLALAAAGAAAAIDAPAVQRTITGATVSVEFTPAPIPIPLKTSTFLLDHPDLTAFIANRHKIAPYRVDRLGPRRWVADDATGTRGAVSLVAAAPRRREYYGDGVHRRLRVDIRAAVVMDMYLTEVAGPGAAPATQAAVRVWVKIKNPVVSSLVVSLRPFLRGMVERKFAKALRAAEAVGRLLASEPQAVAKDVRAFPALSAKDRAAFLKMLKPAKSAPASARP
jgi:hypothetical protein